MRVAQVCTRLSGDFYTGSTTTGREVPKVWGLVNGELSVTKFLFSKKEKGSGELRMLPIRQVEAAQLVYSPLRYLSQLTSADGELLTDLY